MCIVWEACEASPYKHKRARILDTGILIEGSQSAGRLWVNADFSTYLNINYKRYINQNQTLPNKMYYGYYNRRAITILIYPTKSKSHILLPYTSTWSLTNTALYNTIITPPATINPCKNPPRHRYFYLSIFNLISFSN